MELYTLVDIRNEYLKKSEYNVISVDYRRLVVAPCYLVAVRNLPHVGECLAQLIERMKELGASDIHVIGFSLGAHVPAFTANYLKPYKLPRITGLDPAGPTRNWTRVTPILSMFITLTGSFREKSKDAGTLTFT